MPGSPRSGVPDRPAEGLPAIDPLGRGTLGRRLVVRIGALVAVVALLLSALTTLAAGQILQNSIDRQLDAAFTRQDRVPRGEYDARTQPPVDLSPALPIGTIVVMSGEGEVRGGIRSERQDQGSDLATNITVPAAKALLALPTDASRRSLRVPDYGHYRAMAQQRGGTVYVVALPLAETDHTLQELIGIEAVLAGLAIACAVLFVRTVVVRSLQPLNRLASTAQQVSRLELSRGEVELPVRVAPEDADPNNEVGQVGAAFNHMLGNVEGALAARQRSESKVRQFVADASHELRNPLAAIRGYAELTRRTRDEVPPDTAFAMERVESEAARMSKLVEDMLLLARLDSQLELTLTEVDVTELILNAVSDARAANPAYDWRLELPEEPVSARADAFRLHQVVANLLANARTHTPEGTTVTTGVRTDGEMVVITVADTGPGVPAEIRDRVFERFTRADTARARSGRSKDSTGLGLAIVSAVMEAHHGSAAVESEPGRTVFSLRVPRA